ncbi:MAG: glycosyltransferase family 1 protein [Candidatus Moranbacteria bacterium]|nr:glycosyltransferase family 1 protein [Candidatus Moranbacteria bacterium]
MKIAIQVADLDASRIDGTRVYIHNMLKFFGKLDPASEFFLYHKNKFNPELVPPDFPNYKIKQKNFPLFWTQLWLCGQLRRDKPDVLWMPMHNIPILHGPKMKTVVTAHDLAYKYFPEYFPKKDLFKLNLLGKWAFTKADKIIAISESTKKDILKFYPSVPESLIRVIYHGFDAEVFSVARDFSIEQEVKNRMDIAGDYILYAGAIQPRKNLGVLVDAFNLFKTKTKSEIKLVIAGEKAWLSNGVFDQIKKSPFQKDIITPGRLTFSDMGHLVRGANVYVYPSLYEGFGIPVLEILASRVPLICALNSSLGEAGGDAPLYFQEKNPADLAEKIELVLNDENLRTEMIKKGLLQIKKFSWEKCARETLEYIKS